MRKRVSVIKDDPGYRPDAWRYDVMLDGRPARYAVTAEDGPCGFVTRYRLDADGKFMHRGGELLLETVRGEVTINGFAQESPALLRALRAHRARTDSWRLGVLAVHP